MKFGLVNASFSLPEWQAVKMTFFNAPWAFKRDQLNKTNTLENIKILKKKVE